MLQRLLALKYWYLFALVVITLGLSVYCFVQKFKKSKGNIVDGDSVKMFLWLWFSGFLLMLVSEKDGVTDPVLNAAESVYRSLRLFYADGSAKFALESDLLNGCFWAAYYGIALYAPLTLVCTVLSYFDNAFTLLKLHMLAKWTNLVVFNELNEKNLEIAKNLKAATAEKGKKRSKTCVNAFFHYDSFCALENKNKKIFVFCDVYKENKEAHTELVQAAHEFGCYLLTDDIVTLHKRIRKRLGRRADRKLTRYFLSGADENENVRHAVEISQMEKETPLRNLAMFAFATGDANGHILEALNTKEEFFVKRINPSLMMAIDVLTDRENRLLTQENCEKDLKVLILGLGSYGFEMGKFLSWYYQRQRGNITVHFVDREPAAQEALSGKYSDFLSYCPDLQNRERNACFRLQFHTGVDVFSEAFVTVLRDIVCDPEGPGLDGVFCVLGDDNANVEAALHIRTLLDRLHYDQLSQINRSNLDRADGKFEDTDFVCDGYCYQNGKLEDKIRIFCVVHNEKIKNNACHSDGFVKKCNITFVGENASVYGYETIFDARLEHRAMENNRGADTDRPIVWYNSAEYYRNSALSEVLFEEHITAWYPVKPGEDYVALRRIIGNKRWNAYMLASGYTHFPVEQKYAKQLFAFRKEMLPMRRWDRGKWHNSICDFDKLSEEEQQNNYAPPKEC